MKTVTDLFEKHLGVREYNGIVATMLKWYYGELRKVAWCAVSMSYMMNQLGLLDQIGGKNQNSPKNEQDSSLISIVRYGNPKRHNRLPNFLPPFGSGISAKGC